MSHRTIFLAAAALMFTATAWAHHNMSAIYDFNDKITMTGTLSKIDWRNPHIELVVETKNGGVEVQSWSLEGPSPNFSVRAISIRPMSRQRSASRSPPKPAAPETDLIPDCYGP
jgi:hypothetical protein